MRICFILVALLFSSMAFASGKLSFQPTLFLESDQVAPQVGFAVYEKLGVFGVAYSTYTGLGWQPRRYETPVFWASTKHDLEKWFDDVGVSVGFTLRHAQQDAPGLLSHEHDVHAKFTLKLW